MPLTPPLMSETAVTKSLTTLERYAPADKAAAYERFLNTDLDLIDIAIATGIPKRVIAGWAKEGDWAKKKEELEIELMRAAEGKYRNFLLTHKMATLERHMALAQKLEEQIGKLLDETDDAETPEMRSRLLRRLSETLAAVTGVSARAMGIADKAGPVAAAPPPPQQGKRTLVAFGIVPRLSAGEQPAIDAQVVEITEGEQQ